MAQITGYRKDRLGARIIALGNLLFLEDKFGASVEYLWPDAFESHDMAVDDSTHPIFDDAFREKYVTAIAADQRPQVDHLTDLDSIKGRTNGPAFQQRLEKGEAFLCMEGLQPLLFANEVGPSHIEAFRASMARMAFSEPVIDAIETALAALKTRGETPLALHVRRGDVLDVAPWCHKNWTSKYAPDEFYEAVMDTPGVSALLFSDTPAAARRIIGNRRNAITLDDLLDTPHLSEMQRDLVELVLMSRCEGVAAPSLSAFSSSAALISGIGLKGLPSSLPAEAQTDAYDRLLRRVLDAPESFYNIGDFAQSLGYAFGHALRKQEHVRLYKRLKTKFEDGEDFAFFKPLTMALAIANHNSDHAVALHKQAQTDPNLWPEELMVCDALGCVAAHITGDKIAAKTKFLQLYLERNKSALFLDSIANYFFTFEPIFKDLFMVTDQILTTFQYGKKQGRMFLFPLDDTFAKGALNSAFPIWIPAADWPELFEKQQIIKNITNEPTFFAKRLPVPLEIREMEVAHFREKAPLSTDQDVLPLLSSLSVSLALSGRMRRATSIMFHCRKHDPENPLYLKRLANRFRVSRDHEKEEHNLTRAMPSAPEHVGLTLAYAQLLQAQDKHQEASDQLQVICDQEVLPMTYFKTWELSLRKLKSRDYAREVIAEAARRFPDHRIFANQWQGKF